MSHILIDVVGNSFVLTGDTSCISNKRRARSNFMAIGAEFHNTSQIIIHFSSKDGPANLPNREERFQQIDRLLKKFSIAGTQSPSTEKLLDRINTENKNFSQFSIKAKKIRNNIHTGDDFYEFTESVRSELTSRTLYPLQLLSAYHLAFAQNGCNFSVPGAGKTSVVYGAYSYLKRLEKADPKHVDRLLVVGPIASFAPWERRVSGVFWQRSKSKKGLMV